MSGYFAIAGPAQPATLIGGSEVFRRDRFGAHLSSVETLIGAGIEPPREWVALKSRFASFLDAGNPSADRLAHAVIEGSGDLVALRNHAVLEAMSRAEADAEVTTRVRGEVLAELESINATVSAKNYRLAASRYDQAAKAFTAAFEAVNVEADGNALVTASAKAREAWLTAPQLAADLDEHLRVLLAAASLAGAPADVAYLTGATDIVTTEYQIAIATDPGRSHRRRVWAGWLHANGRTGRWGALAALGARLRAAKDPAGVEPYGRPEQPIPVVGPNSALTHWDPHDGPIPANHRPIAVGWVGEHQNTDHVL